MVKINGSGLCALLLLMYLLTVLAWIAPRAHASEKSPLFPAKVGLVQLGEGKKEEKKKEGRYLVVTKSAKSNGQIALVTFVIVDTKDPVAKPPPPIVIPVPARQMWSALVVQSFDIETKGDVSVYTGYAGGQMILTAKLEFVPDKKPDTV